MGRSNRLDANERKIALLLGEKEALYDEIKKAEEAAEKLPHMRERLWEIDTLVNACEAIIKDDHPDWTSDRIRPLQPFVHKIPVKIGNASRLALQALREADRPLTIREIAIEVLRREGHDNPDADTEGRVANAVGNALRKHAKAGTPIQSDGQWPARWSVSNK